MPADGSRTTPPRIARHPARQPAFQLPAGAVDCHLHVVGGTGRYAFSDHRAYTPDRAELSDYDRVARTLGLARRVLVQPSFYGTDHACIVDALEASTVPTRGIAVVDARTGDEELRALSSAGFVGARLNLAIAGGTPVDELDAVAARVGELGWHVQLFLSGAAIVELEDRLARLPTPVVVDHLGMPVGAAGVVQPGFRALLRLLARGHVWVKLSGAYRVDVRGAPWALAAPYARALLQSHPDRLVWGSDWPHVALEGPMPDDAELLESLREWCDGDAALIAQVLVTNPQSLYGFTP